MIWRLYQGNKSGSLSTPASMLVMMDYADFFLAAAFFGAAFFAAGFLAFFSATGASCGLKAASFFIRRPLRRAALLGCSTPLCAALSRTLTAFMIASLVSGAFAAEAARA